MDWESELLYDWRFTANQFVLATSPLRRHSIILFFTLTLAVIFVMQHPLWREDGSAVYNCCWSSPAQSFSGQNPAGLMTTFYCLRFETPLTWKARSPYLYHPGTERPGYTSRHWVPFSSPPTTRRAKVHVFDPASTRKSQPMSKSKSKSKSKLCYDRQFIGQSVLVSITHLGLKNRFFSVWQLRVCWCEAPSLKRGCLLQCAMYNIFTFFMLLY
jgi:hypothetical protein